MPMNVSLDCLLGRVRSVWNAPSSPSLASDSRRRTARFTKNIKKEIKVQGDTSNGKSGGPCCNLQGEVIGIITRADDQYSNSYLAPCDQWFSLLLEASRKT